jgi:hypothetical protein
MQNILDAQRHSAVLTVAENKATDVLNYNLQKSLNYVGGMASQKIVLNANALAAGMLNGSSFSVNLPQYGLLKRAFVRFTVTAAGGNVTVCKYPGIQAFNRIVLQTTSGNVISTLYGDTIVHKMLQRSDASKLAAAAGPAAVIDGASATVSQRSRTYYCPLLFPFFDAACNWPDLMSMEDLCLMFYPKTSAEWSTLAAGASLNAAAGPQFDLVLYYSLPQPDRYLALLAEKHPGGATWNTIMGSQFLESRAQSDGNNQVSIPLYCGSPVVRTIVAVRTAVSGNASGNIYAPSNITSFSIRDSGGIILESNYWEVTLENGISAEADSSMITINWGELGSFGLDNPRAMTAVSLYSMSNPTINLTFGDGAAGTTKYCYVYHETLQACSVTASPNNKNRQISVLSDK